MKTKQLSMMSWTLAQHSRNFYNLDALRARRDFVDFRLQYKLYYDFPNWKDKRCLRFLYRLRSTNAHYSALHYSASTAAAATDPSHDMAKDLSASPTTTENVMRIELTLYTVLKNFNGLRTVLKSILY